MYFNSGSPVADAQAYLAHIDAKEHDYAHKCDACKCGFDNRTGGVKIEDEKFCRNCVATFNHFDFYRNECGLTARQIYEITGKAITL